MIPPVDRKLSFMFSRGKEREKQIKCDSGVAIQQARKVILATK